MVGKNFYSGGKEDSTYICGGVVNGSNCTEPSTVLLVSDRRLLRVKKANTYINTYH